MTVVSGELEYIKSNWIARMKASVTHLQVGDDNTAPSESNTTIGNLLTGGTATIESLDESVTDQLTWTVKYGITAFVGSTVKEVTTYTGSAIKTRDLTVESLKGADQIFWVSLIAGITAQNS